MTEGNFQQFDADRPIVLYAQNSWDKDYYPGQDYSQEELDSHRAAHEDLSWLRDQVNERHEQREAEKDRDRDNDR